ncbi:aspartate/glutamate racemase family protein [Brevibacillus massiliensis]|uniref:aspartate/glutamate racemase family protein n=1 Tax=Brevibacillus massiliensis TaxID=1118054 RepID=UPI0002F380A5|nr:aspartate/glutamate racemase family protein [Brevibacillus massiliensis]
MRIKVILPITSPIFLAEMKREGEYYASKGTEVGVCCLDFGPASIESEYDEALCVPNFLEKAVEAEKEGYEGIISNCFADPAVKPARELLRIPVVGPGESSMHIASMLGQSFSVLTVLPNVIPTIKNNARIYGVHEKLASIRSVNIPVLEVDDKERLTKVLVEEAVKAIELDQAHALILGCTGMMGVAADIQKSLAAKGYDVPVIDPIFAAIKMLESIVHMGIRHSKLTYMTPPPKQRTFCGRG